MFAIKPWSFFKCNKELTTIGVSTSVCTRQEVFLSMLYFEVLIRKLLTVDRLTTCAITFGKVTTLCHEAIDYSMESTALIVEHLATNFWSASFTSAELSEVFSSSWGDILKQLHNDGSNLFSSYFHIEIDARIWFWSEWTHNLILTFNLIFQNK